MNPEQWRAQYRRRKTSKRYMGAVIIVFMGVILLLKRLPLQIPEWIFSWDTIVLVIGLLLGIRSRFRNWLWLVLVLLSTGSILSNYFLLDQYKNLVFPIELIIFGIYIFFRCFYHRNDKDCFVPRSHEHPSFAKHNRPFHHSYSTTEDGDVINIENTFGETNRNIISKEFRGGTIKNTFGSVDLNLTQSDIQGKIYIYVENTFGGIAFFVPSNWKIISEIDAKLSGIDDKSFYDVHPDEEEKTLVLKGKSVFGGIEIKNFA